MSQCISRGVVELPTGDASYILSREWWSCSQRRLDKDMQCSPLKRGIHSGGANSMQDESQGYGHSQDYESLNCTSTGMVRRDGNLECTAASVDYS